MVRHTLLRVKDIDLLVVHGFTEKKLQTLQIDTINSYVYLSTFTELIKLQLGMV